MVLVLVAVAAADGVALAQTTFGGGRLPTVEIPREYRPTVGVTLQTRGDQVAMRFETSLLCGRQAYDVSGRRVVPVNNSSFAAAGASVMKLTGGRLEFAWTVTGTIAGQSADGVLRIRGRVRTGNGRWRACDQRPTRAFQTRAQWAQNGPASGPERGGAYLGVTDQPIVDGLPGSVFIRVDDSGRIAGRWHAAAPCTRGPREVFTNFTPSSAVRADSSFYRAERFSQRFSDALVRYRVRFSGRFTTLGAYGTLQLRASVYDRSGRKLLTRCDSGRRSWTAMRASASPASPPPPPPPT